MAVMRAAVIGLGWMGLLYDLAKRIPDRFEVDDVDRPTPPLDVNRRIHHHEHPGDAGVPDSYSEALWDREEVELVAAADRDPKRLSAFAERYGVDAVYTDGDELLEKERPELVAVCTNTKYRAHFTLKAIACGAKGIATEKPMAHTLDEADRMVAACTRAGAPLCCGAITTTHPSFARARALLEAGAIGDLVSLESSGPCAQHQNWAYFLDRLPDWVVGAGDAPRRESGSDEFTGTGLAWSSARGLAVHFRPGAPGLRLSGSRGEMTFSFHEGWQLWSQVEGPAGTGQAQLPWPAPQFLQPYGSVYCVADVLDCLAGRLDEPKNSGRRVAIALEVEVALKLSAARGGTRVELPLADRSLGLHYDWFR